MDPTTIPKFQAMKKRKKNVYFLNTLIFHCLTVFVCTLLCSSPFWFPSLLTSTKSFFFDSVPKSRSFLFNPKCLFIVCNIIIVFLVGESKLGIGSSSSSSSCSSSSAADIYDEYIKRSQNIQRFYSHEVKKEERKLEKRFIKENTKKVHEDRVIGGDSFEGDDLKRRVEDFIAKVNRQRKLEAEQLS